MPKLISIWDVGADLGYTDLRRLKNWCIRYGVGIVQFSGSNKMYVMDVEYEHAKESAPIKYSSDKKVFYANSITQKSETRSCSDSTGKVHKYKPTGEIEKAILSRLLSLKPEL